MATGDTDSDSLPGAGADPSSIQRPDGRWTPDPALAEVNECLRQYKVEMFRGDDGKHRIWGDINRIQDIVFGECLKSFPEGAHQDLDDFFASEVDARMADCLRRNGVEAKVELSDGPGIEFIGEPPPDEVLDKCVSATYDYYSVPPTMRR